MLVGLGLLLGRHQATASQLEALQAQVEANAAEPTAFDCVLPAVPTAEPALPTAEPIWADRVLSRSSQYGPDSWSSEQVLGEPSVYPSGLDAAGAWAPLEQDRGTEHIFVSFSEATSAAGVAIYETFNPGAVKSVHFYDRAGNLIDQKLQQPRPVSTPSRRHVVSIPCTNTPVSRVWIELDTAAVAGWNEIDAVQLLRCGEQ